MGKKINLLKAQAVDLIAIKKTELEDKKLCEEINQKWTDLTIVGKPKSLGRIRPISQAKKEVLEILSSFGFIEETGPNIEDEWHLLP